MKKQTRKERRKWPWLLILGVATLLLAACLAGAILLVRPFVEHMVGMMGTALAGMGKPFGEIAVGEEAPDFTLESLDGQTVSLKDYRGQVVVVDFWATWCVGCVMELPDIQKLYEKYKDQDVVVLAISLDTQENKVARLVQKKGWTFTVLLDSQVEVACRYGASGIPRTLVIDREGVVRHVEDGYSPGTRELLAQTIEEALK